MKKYYISTDSGSEEITAKNIHLALEEWGEAPESVDSALKFEVWLEEVGGYGVIEENGIQIARVAA